MSIVLTAVRRSVGCYFLLAFLAVELLNLQAHGLDWSVTWGDASQVTATVMVLQGPLVAAAGAAAAVELMRRGTVIRSVAPYARWRLHLVSSLAVSVWAVGAHLVAVGAVWVVTALRHHDVGFFDPFVIGASLLVLVANVAVGYCAGVWLPRLMTPPLVGILLYALVPFLGVDDRLVLAGAGTADLLGMEQVPSTLVAQAGWFAAVTVVAMLLFGKFGVKRAAAAVAIGVAGALAGVTVLHSGVNTRRPQAHPSLVCADGTPKVCASADIPDSLSPLRHAAMPLAAAAAHFAPGHEVRKVVGLSTIAAQPSTVAVPTAPRPPYVSADQVAIAFAEHLAECAPNGVRPESFGDVATVSNYLLRQAGSSATVAVGLPVPSEPDARAALVRLTQLCRS